MLARLDAALETLSPSYFALVMATGIISVAALLLGVPVLPTALFAFNVVAYLVLWVLTVLRLIHHRASFFNDLTSHQRAFGFLTVVAGTGVLGTQSILLGHDYAIPTVLLSVAVVLWVVLTYTIFTALTIKKDKPSLVDGISGAIEHIETHSSHHTEAIVAEDGTAVERFFNEIDSAILLHNASTQFADGGEFGMGAEIGIATGKMHARGPVGVEQLTSFKYRVRGSGQVRP